MKRTLSAVLALAIATACVTVSRTMLSQDFIATPVPPEQVNVLMASLGDSIPPNCVRVAIMHASGAQDATDEGDFLTKLREEAGEVGANTVFVQNMEDAGTAERIVGGLLGTGADRDSESLALRCPPTP